LFAEAKLTLFETRWLRNRDRQLPAQSPTSTITCMKTLNPAKNRRKWMYGLTEEAFNAQLAAQKNRCAICDLIFEVRGRRGPHIDHDHDVHRLRGMLCFRCNLLLGYAEDDPELLKRAAAYLEQFYLTYLESVGYDQQTMDFLHNVKKARKHWAERVRLIASEAKRLADFKPNGEEW
jgi:hypothetical protein